MNNQATTMNAILTLNLCNIKIMPITIITAMKISLMEQLMKIPIMKLSQNKNPSPKEVRHTSSKERKKIPCFTPKTSFLTPKISFLTPKISFLTPKTSFLTPKTSGLTPKISGLGRIQIIPQRILMETIMQTSNRIQRVVTTNSTQEVIIMSLSAGTIIMNLKSPRVIMSPKSRQIIPMGGLMMNTIAMIIIINSKLIHAYVLYRPIKKEE